MVNKNIFILSLMLTSIYASDEPERGSKIARIGHASAAAAASSTTIQKNFGTCPICHETIDSLKKAMRGRCSDKHLFHTNCIWDWLKTPGSEFSCPLCRDQFWKKPTLREDDYLAAGSTGDIVKLRSILDSGAEFDINIKFRNGNTALIMACVNGHKDVVQFLMEKPELEINAQGQEGNTALLLACYHKRTDIVEMLLKRTNLDVNIKNNHNHSAIYIAFILSVPEIIMLLLAREELDLTGQFNDKSPLVIACVKGYFDVIESLLKRADISLSHKDSRGKTALMYAQQFCQPKIVALLEEAIAKRS